MTCGFLTPSHAASALPFLGKVEPLAPPTGADVLFSSERSSFSPASSRSLHSHLPCRWHAAPRRGHRRARRRSWRHRPRPVSCCHPPCGLGAIESVGGLCLDGWVVGDGARRLAVCAGVLERSGVHFNSHDRRIGAAELLTVLTKSARLVTNPFRLCSRRGRALISFHMRRAQYKRP